MQWSYPAERFDAILGSTRRTGESRPLIVRRGAPMISCHLPLDPTRLEARRPDPPYKAADDRTSDRADELVAQLGLSAA